VQNDDNQLMPDLLPQPEPSIEQAPAPHVIEETPASSLE
jgi:hypothetical protein